MSDLWSDCRYVLCFTSRTCGYAGHCGSWRPWQSPAATLSQLLLKRSGFSRFFSCTHGWEVPSNMRRAS